MNKKIAVFAFFHETHDELKKRFDFLERLEKAECNYHTILDIRDVWAVMESNRYREVYVSSVGVFDHIEDFSFFSEVVLGNNANYFIGEEGIDSRTQYHIWEILAKISNSFNCR